MLKHPNFYSVIIGTELLNGRREDKHFTFLNEALRKRGWEQKANFVIGDDVALMEEIFHLIKKDPNGVMFCFGGIGATPDDLTRQSAANVFGDGRLYTHIDAKTRIIKEFGDDAYPHRINMAELPKGAKLLENVVNNVAGFYIDAKYFFTPGFPKMAQPMVEQALSSYYPQTHAKYSESFVVESSENDLIEIMQALPKEVEFSSLPKFIGEKRIVEIYLAHNDIKILTRWVTFFRDAIKEKKLNIKEIK